MTDGLVVLPVYNEADNLERVVAGVRAAGCAVLVVDDNSPDGSGALADRLASADPGVRVLHRPRKLGLGGAYIAGFQWGLDHGYGLLLEMDADGSHDPRYLPELLATASRVDGLAIGSRYVRGGAVRGWPLHRVLLSWGANVYARLILRTSVRDITSGYRCYTRATLDAIRLGEVVAQGYAFQIEMAVRCLAAGRRVAEVPIVFEDRVAGQSKVSRGEVYRALLAVIRLRFTGFGQGREPAERRLG